MNRALRIQDTTAVEHARALTLVRHQMPPLPDAASRPDASGALDGIIGASDAMRTVLGRLSRIAATDAPVLLTGERGTGKTTAAHALHRLSARRRHPFITVDCAAWTADALELALFDAAHGGLFDAADGGTLFLDEVGDLSPVAQARLWRVLERGEIDRPGRATLTRRVDVRVMAASHRPLEGLVREGRFRDDLLYRLRIVSVKLPALRMRGDDIGLLVESFVNQGCTRHGIPRPTLDYAAWECLRRYSWPGNVRELRHVIESAVMLADGGVITPRDLPPALSTHVDPSTGHEPTAAAQDSLTFVEARERALRDFDREFLRAALARYGGNVARTARALGLHRQSLQKLITRRDLRVAPHHSTDESLSTEPR